MEDGRNMPVRNALNQSYTGLVERDDDKMFAEGCYSIYMRIEVRVTRVISSDIDV
jgi:hypothetical protein